MAVDTHDTRAMEAPSAAVDQADDVARGVDGRGSLAQATTRGVAWVASARLGGQVLQFAASLVLARLLLPNAYGLVAITWTFSGFALLLCDLGLGAALVQGTRLTREDASTAFTINLLVGFAFTALVLAISHPLAALLGQPRLAGLLEIASIGFSISATTVPMALLERQMRFAIAGALDIGPTVAGLLVSIGCAFAGLGAVSLVIGPLAAMAISTIGGFAVTGWYPQALPTLSSARRLLGFCGHLAGYNTVNYWATNLDNLLIGGFVGASALGFYNRAYMLMMMPVLQVNSVIGRVLLPVFASINNDLGRLRRAFQRMTRAVCCVMFPFSLGLAGAAHNFVLVAFGPHWRGAIPLVMILAGAGAPQVIATLSSIACQATGQTRLLTTWGNFNSFSILAAVAIGLPWGAIGVAAAFTIRASVMLPIAVLPARRTIGVTTRDISRLSARPFAAAAATGAGMFALGAVLDLGMPAGLVLLIQLLWGCLFYVGLLRLVAPIALNDAYRLLRFRSAST